MSDGESPNQIDLLGVRLHLNRMLWHERCGTLIRNGIRGKGPKIIAGDRDYVLQNRFV